MSYDPSEHVHTRDYVLGVISGDSELLASRLVGEPKLLLYGAQSHREELLADESSYAHLASLIAVMTMPERRTPTGTPTSSSLTFESRGLAAILANRLDMLFRLESREANRTHGGSYVTEAVNDQLENWRDGAESNAWWPSSIQEPTIAHHVGISAGGQILSVGLWRLGRVFVSNPFVVPTSPQSVGVVGFRGSVPNTMSLALIDAFDVEQAHAMRLMVRP